MRVKTGPIHLFQPMLTPQSVKCAEINEDTFQFVLQQLPQHCSCYIIAYLKKLGFANCAFQHLVFWSIAHFVVRLARQHPDHPHVASSLGAPLNGRYKDGIGRSQTYLMLLYRLDSYLAQKITATQRAEN